MMGSSPQQQVVPVRPDFVGRQPKVKTVELSSWHRNMASSAGGEAQ